MRWCATSRRSELPMKKPSIRITLVERRGKRGCSRGHRIGDSWDYDTQRGELCPMAMHTAFVYADILRCGGVIPHQKPGEGYFSCPDPDTLNIFKIEVVPDQD